MLIRRFLVVAITLLLPWTVFAQRPRTRPTSGPPPELQRAAEIIRDWGQSRAAEGNRACRFQAILNRLIDVDRILDPMQPNVSLSKVADRLGEAMRLLPQDADPVSSRLHALLVTATEIFDPHLSPDVPAQRERFHRDVLDPASRIVTPEIIAFVETTQQLDLTLRSVAQTQSEMSALILHAIHGDCAPQDRVR